MDQLKETEVWNNNVEIKMHNKINKSPTDTSTHFPVNDNLKTNIRFVLLQKYYRYYWKILFLILL